MSFMSLQPSFWRRATQDGGAPPPSNIYPYYGVAVDPGQPSKNSAFILGLAYRGPNADRTFPSPGFSLDAPTGSNLSMFYAYPVSYGEAVFTDLSPGGGGFQGGWDGAHGDYGSTLGPIIVPVTISGTVVNFYLYQTDYSELGQMTFSVS